MAGESGSDGHGGVVRMLPQQEMLVRGHGIEASLGVQQASGKSREGIRKPLTDRALVGGKDFAANALRGAVVVTAVEGDFDAFGIGSSQRKAI